MGWTDERVDRLKTLWAEGLSASQIAKVLGEVTRNAVIGKVHRLGLSGRATPSRAERPRIRSSMPRQVMHRAAPPEPVIVQEPVKTENGESITVVNISRQMCKWPIGDPSENEFKFCGHATRPGSPYCEAHSRMAFQPAQNRRDRRGSSGGR